MLGEQLRSLQLINHAIGYDAYFTQTIFCPLGVAKYLAGNKAEPVMQTIREDRDAMHAALACHYRDVYQPTLLPVWNRGRAASSMPPMVGPAQSMLTPDQYREFGEQYDLEFLDAIKSRSKFNILHNCGTHIYFDQLASYPVQAINWDANAPGNPDLRQGKRSVGESRDGRYQSENHA